MRLATLVAGLIPIVVGLVNLFWHFYGLHLLAAYKLLQHNTRAAFGQLSSLWASASSGLRLLVVTAGGLVVVGTLLICTDTVTTDKLGQSGDFMGGWLNPLVGLITIYLLVNTLKTQAESLKLQEQAMKEADARNLEMLKIQSKGAFEQSLFTMNSAYRTNLASLTFTPESTELKGPEALEKMVSKLFFDPVIKELNAKKLRVPDSVKAAREDLEAVRRALECVVKHWKKFLLTDPNIRSLLSQQMQLFRWINRHRFLTEDDEYAYSAAIRAQLTRGEVVAWHIHILTEPFDTERNLINRYGLFALMSSQSHSVLVLARKILAAENRISNSAFRWRGSQPLKDSKN